MGVAGTRERARTGGVRPRSAHAGLRRGAGGDAEEGAGLGGGHGRALGQVTGRAGTAALSASAPVGATVIRVPATDPAMSKDVTLQLA